MNPVAQLRASVRRLTEALSPPLPAGDVHQRIVEEARALTQASSAALCLLNRERDMLDFVAVAGENAEEIVGLRIRVADSLSEPVVTTGTQLLLQGDPASATPNAPRSAAIVPIRHNGRILGTLSAQNRLPSAESPALNFSDDDLETLTLLAELVALARDIETTTRTAREQSRELAVLYDAARTISSSLNIQEVMDSVLAAICTHLEYHSAVLFLLNDEHTHLFIAAERGLAPEEREVQLAVESCIPARVLGSGQPRLIPDTDQDPDFVDISERARALSAMVAPIRSRDETHGLILVTSLQRNAYREEDLNLLASVAMQAGIAMENAWLYEDAQRQAEEASALYDLSQHVNATLHLDRVLNFVADSVLNLLKVDKFALMLYNRKADRLITRLARNIDLALFRGSPARVGEGIGGWVFEWQTPQAVSDVSADPRNASAPIDTAGVASTLCVPMHVGDEVIGIIHAMSSKRRLFTVAEMELLYTIANQAAVAIVNATLYQDARSKSHEMRRYLRRIAHAIGSALDEQDMPQLMADLSVELMQADRCAVYSVAGEEARLRATSHFRSAVPPDAIVPLGSGLCGWVARRGQSLALMDLSSDPRSREHAWLSRDRLSSYLAVPLKSNRHTVGVIEIYTIEPREFSREEVQLLATFARRARLAERLLLDA